MNKQKALHALRGLEMTFEQKQEFIEALAEGDSAGDCGEITIDISPIIDDNSTQIPINKEQLSYILKHKVKFISIFEITTTCLIISEIEDHLGGNEDDFIRFNMINTSNNNGLSIEVYINRLLITMPAFG